MGDAAVVILAAGSGTRMGGDRNKILLPLNGAAVVTWSVRAALATAGVRRVVVVVRPGEQPFVADALAKAAIDDERVGYVDGGSTRHESERLALAALAAEIRAELVRIIAIHDAARPWVEPELFSRVILSAAEHGGALPVVDLDCVVSKDGSALPTGLVAVQTPQAFRAGALLTAYTEAKRHGFEGTDTAACIEKFVDHLRIAAVTGSSTNSKITVAADLPRAQHPST